MFQTHYIFKISLAHIPSLYGKKSVFNLMNPKNNSVTRFGHRWGVDRDDFKTFGELDWECQYSSFATRLGAFLSPESCVFFVSDDAEFA